MQDPSVAGSRDDDHKRLGRRGMSNHVDSEADALKDLGRGRQRCASTVPFTL